MSDDSRSVMGTVLASFGALAAGCQSLRSAVGDDGSDTRSNALPGGQPRATDTPTPEVTDTTTTSRARPPDTSGVQSPPATSSPPTPSPTASTSTPTTTTQTATKTPGTTPTNGSTGSVGGTGGGGTTGGSSDVTGGGSTDGTDGGSGATTDDGGSLEPTDGPHARLGGESATVEGTMAIDDRLSGYLCDVNLEGPALVHYGFTSADAEPLNVYLLPHGELEAYLDGGFARACASLTELTSFDLGPMRLSHGRYALVATPADGSGVVEMDYSASLLEQL